jgi:hypothetical protein
MSQKRDMGHPIWMWLELEERTMNGFEKGVVAAAKDVEHVAVVVGRAVVKGVDFLPKAVRLIDTAIKDQPALKAAVLQLIEEGAAALKDGEAAVAAGGVNLASDALVTEDAIAFFNYFKSAFVPQVEAIYTEVVADLK